MRVHFFLLLGTTALFFLWVAPWQIGTGYPGRAGENWAFFATHSADRAVDLLRGLGVLRGPRRPDSCRCPFTNDGSPA